VWPQERARTRLKVPTRAPAKRSFPAPPNT